MAKIRGRSDRRLDLYEAALGRGVIRVDECLVSQATVQSSGYRYIQRNRMSHYVHRLSFEKWHGEIPDGYHVDHECHNEAVRLGLCAGGACHHRSCINPAHLRAVTPGVNVTSSPFFDNFLNFNGKKEKCKRGHDFDEKNTCNLRKGGRQCRTCAAEYQRNYSRAKRSGGYWSRGKS